MSAIDDLAFTRNFEPGGPLDQEQPKPHLVAQQDVVERGIAKMHADDSPRLREDFGRQSLDFHRELARAMLEVVYADSDLINGKALTTADWANLIGTPATRQDRRHLLLRLGGRKLHEGTPAAMVLPELLVHNRAMCIPPLAVPEVVLLWESLCKYDPGRRS
jgi:hypothetical protein